MDEGVRLLVLGSLPGEQSLARQQYYAHPQNQFWRLMSAVVAFDLTGLGYAARLDALLAAKVGLWDMVASASRSGSLDSNIKGHDTNDVRTLAAALPELRAVSFNGGKAAVLGRKALGPATGFDLVPLPSSSPAYTRPFAEKRAAWMTLRCYLGD